MFGNVAFHLLPTLFIVTFFFAVHTDRNNPFKQLYRGQRLFKFSDFLPQTDFNGNILRASCTAKKMFLSDLFHCVLFRQDSSVAYTEASQSTNAVFNGKQEVMLFLRKTGIVAEGKTLFIKRLYFGSERLG